MEQNSTANSDKLVVIHGRVSNRQNVRTLTGQLEAKGLHGTLYQGYLLPGNAENLITVDILLVTREHGLVFSCIN